MISAFSSLKRSTPFPADQKQTEGVQVNKIIIF